MASGNLSSYQKFEAVTIHRSKLQNAPYNPRTMTAKARAKLKKNISKVGLLEPPIWNKRTGNLVGGHQRLSIMDALEKSPDYSLTVAVVDLSEKEEREQNIALNNGEAQGEWDFDKLEGMFREGLNIDATGFDSATLLRMFGSIPGEADKGDADELEEIAKTVDAAKEVRKSMGKNPGDPYSDDMDYYLVLVGGNNAQVEVVEDALQLDASRYHDLRIVGRLIGLAASKGATIDDIREWVAGEHDDECDQRYLEPDKADEVRGYRDE